MTARLNPGRERFNFFTGGAVGTEILKHGSGADHPLTRATTELNIGFMLQTILEGTNGPQQLNRDDATGIGNLGASNRGDIFENLGANTKISFWF